VMSQQCVYMIHDPMFGNTGGNARELRSDADRLDMYGDIIISIYERKTGASSDVIREMMAAETWMNADTALANGFVDEVVEEIAIDWGVPNFGAMGGSDYWFMDYLYDSSAQNNNSQAAPVAYTGQETYRKAVLNFINMGLQPATPGHAPQTNTIMSFVTKITDALVRAGLIESKDTERANEAISGIDLVEAVRNSAGQVSPEQIRAAITAMSEDDRKSIFPTAVAATPEARKATYPN
jgi:enoyl-CoA hydratase/carnithine racemase